MPSAAVTSKGQVTIPKSIREHLHVGEGDRLEFEVEETGRVVLRPATRDIVTLRGLLRRPGRKSVSVEEMNEAIQRTHRKRR